MHPFWIKVLFSLKKHHNPNLWKDLHSKQISASVAWFTCFSKTRWLDVVAKHFLRAKNSLCSLMRKVWNKFEVCKHVRMKSFWKHVENLPADWIFSNFSKYKTRLICQMSLTACRRASLFSVLLGNRVTASSREPRSWSGQWGSWRSNRTSRGLQQKHQLLWK